MSNIREFPAGESTERKQPADPLAFFTHPPRYPASQSVGGAVVGQVVIHPSSPDQSRNDLAQREKSQ